MLVKKPKKISGSFHFFRHALFLSTTHTRNALRSILPLLRGMPSSSWLLRGG